MKRRIVNHRAEPKKAHQPPPLPDLQRESIVSIILRDLATTFRKSIPKIRIEAHPKTETEASLFITVDKRNKLKINAVMIDNGEILMVSPLWTVAGDQHRAIPQSMIPLLGTNGMDLVYLSTVKFFKVSILEPSSLHKLEKWIGDRILALIKHVDSLDHRGSTKT